MTLTNEERMAALAKHGSKCYLCGEALTHLNCTIDHVKPIARGGTDHASNLRPACFKCNQAKGSMTLGEYRNTLGYRLFWFEDQKVVAAQRKLEAHRKKTSQPKSARWDRR